LNSRYRSDRLRRFPLSADEKADVVAFLESLTDEAFLHDPAFADPFASGDSKGQ
jgi:cytochrome c peroxidase